MLWQQLRTSSWLWLINAKFMDARFLKRLESPQDLLSPPAQPIERTPPRTATSLVRLILPEWPESPLFVKYYKPRKLWASCKDFFRHSPARRAFENAFLVQQLNLGTAVPIAIGENSRSLLRRDAFLICAEVPNASTLRDYYVACPDRQLRLTLVRSLARVMARLHTARFSHFDPHPLNFLVSGSDCRNLVMIDLDALRRPVWFTPRTAIKDLKKMFLRSPLTAREELWFAADYCHSRTPRMSAHDLVHALGRHSADKRSSSFNKVPFVSQSNGLRWLARPSLLSPQATAILNGPDEFLTDARVLKPSRSSAVSAQDGLVLKRYNFRKWRNLLKDFFRGSKARRCFFRAIHLERVGVPTARPLAFAEPRCCGVPVRSYLLMEEIPQAANLLEWRGDKRRAIQSLARLIARLHNAGFTHRDLKEGNILFDGDGKPHLVDLDGLRYVRRVKDEWAAADLARLLRAVIGQRLASRADCARFLQTYCRTRRRGDWRAWWKAIDRKRTRT